MKDLHQQRRDIEREIEDRQKAIREHERELAYLYRRREQVVSDLSSTGDEHETEAVG